MKRILVPLDFSRITDCTVDTAFKLARATGATVKLFHVFVPEREPVGYMAGNAYVGYFPDPGVLARERARREGMLRQLVRRPLAVGISTETMMADGAVIDGIMSESEAWKADMIVIGSHGHGALHDLLLGSISEAILHKACCPVTVVPSRLMETEKVDATETDAVSA
jgi:nucleotide-binding universal stress UspA family protein